MPAAFLRAGPDPGSRHAWQLYLLPHWPWKSWAAMGRDNSPPRPGH